MNNIPIEITGDKTLEKNVEQAEKIEASIKSAYDNWKKLSGTGKGKDKDIDKTVVALKKQIEELKKLKKEEDESVKNTTRLEKIQKEYNTTLKKSNQIQTSYASDLQKTNAQMEVLKTNQKLLTAEGKKGNAQYIKNKTTIKELSAEYRKLEKEKLQDIQVSKTLARLDKKQNLTLKEQKQLFSALNIQYNKLVTSEGRASKSTLELQKRMDRLNKSILKSEKAVRMHQRNVGNYPKSMGKMGGAIMGASAALTGMFFALTRVVSGMNRMVEKANEQALSEKKLTVIMKQRMNATDAQVQSMLNLTAVEQELGVVGDEVQIAGLQQLGTFLDQTDSLETLLPAMNNLIVQQKGMNGTQQDAVMIANLFGKVMDGQVSALTRVGISLTDVQKKMIKYGTETEKANILSQVITDNVGNMNLAFAQTDAGKLQNAKNTLGDFGEEIGAKFLPVLANMAQVLVKVIRFFKDFGDKIKELDFIKKLGEAFKGFFSAITDNFKNLNAKVGDSGDKFSALTKFAEGFAKVLTFALNVSKVAIKILSGLINAIIETGKWFVRAGKNIAEFSKKTAKGFVQLNKDVVTFWKNLIKGTTENEKYNNAIEKIQIALSKFGDKLKVIIDKVKEFLVQLKNGTTGIKALELATLPFRNAFNYLGIAFDFAKDKLKEFVEFLSPAIDKITEKIDPLIQTIERLLLSVGLLSNEVQKAEGGLGGGKDFTDLSFFDNYISKLNEIKKANKDINLDAGGDAPTGGGGGSVVPEIDIFGEKLLSQTDEISKKELELRRKYKDDSELIELELLEFKQLKQLELLQFIKENDISEKQIENDLKYLDLSKSLAEKQIAIEKEKYNVLYSDFADFQEKKILENENYILQLEKDGASEYQIEFQKLQDQKDLYTEYLSFLEQNANEENEIERLQLQNQLLDVENQLNDLKENTESDDSVIKNALGLTPEAFEELKGLLSDFTNSYFEFLGSKINADIEYSQKHRELLASQIEDEYAYQQSQRDGLDFENNLRNENFENDALLTESLIRQSKARVDAKKREQQALLLEEQKSAEKLKRVQKAQIYTQFAMDNASAISSLIKMAFANPLNAINPATALIQIGVGMATIIGSFVKARSSIKGLKDGEVDIQGAGTETSDSIPAMLSKGETVTHAKGTKRAKNFLTGLNKNATADQLLQLFKLDFGQDALQENNVIVNFDSYELKKQNYNLEKQIQETQLNNIYLSQLLNFTENKADYISLPNGYRKITRNGETTVIFE